MREDSEGSEVDEHLLERVIEGVTLAATREDAKKCLVQFVDKAKEAESRAGSGDLRRRFGPTAKQVKTGIQMFMGTVGGCIAVAVPTYFFVVPPHVNIQIHAILAFVAVTLAFATAVELSYSFFAQGADELLDSAALALLAAFVLQLAEVNDFNLAQAGAVAIYAVALGGMYLARNLARNPLRQK